MSPHGFRRAALAILAVALVTQAALMADLGDRVYGDVLKAVSFGWLLDTGVYDPARDVVNSKTFLGPWIDYRLFAATGLPGLRAASLATFLAMGALLLAISRHRFDERTRLLALVLFAFYVGTQRSIVAGELDDHVATLLLAAGVLVVLDRGAVFAGALLLGAGFLFKFWVAIFGLGVVVHLLASGRWRRLPAAMLGLALPAAGLTLLDGGGSLRAFVVSSGIQAGFSSWDAVALKSMSTGMVPIALVATAAWIERGRRDDDGLLLCLGLSYFGYVLIARDAFVATTMMSTCLVFSSPLVAAWLMTRAGHWPRARRRAALAALVLSYPLATTAVTRLHLRRDTYPMRLAETPTEAAAMFRYNRPPRPPR